MIIRSPRVRPGKFVFSDAKRLLQQYLPTADTLGLPADNSGLMGRPCKVVIPTATEPSVAQGSKADPTISCTAQDKSE
jgi:hypothetical protein